MAEQRSGPPPALPRWVVLLGSAALTFHLFAIGILVLAAPSGPWPGPFGSTREPPPPFAQAVSEITTTHYLIPLKMDFNYHFPSDRPTSAVYFELRLKDERGEVTQTLKFPEDNANPWVRHRELVLAQQLTEDLPVQPRQGEVIPAPHQSVQTVKIWQGKPGEKEMELVSVPEHLVPRDRPVFRPAPWAMLAAKAYAHYACRAHGAASAEVVRYWRDPVPPDVVFAEEPPATLFTTYVSNFGEYTR
jgi:hypothetical protein